MIAGRRIDWARVFTSGESTRRVRTQRHNVRCERRTRTRQDLYYEIKEQQRRSGISRSLNATNATMCPLNRMENGCYNAIGNPGTPCFFGDGILTESTRLVKWTAADHDFPPGRFQIRSLRAGGATCLYQAGVDLEYIRRFGRWVAGAFAI